MNRYNISKCFRFDKKTSELLSHLVEQDNKHNIKKKSESEYLRELIKRSAREDMGLPKETFVKMARTMAGCGNNINQIAHRVNTDIYTIEDVRLLRECIKDIADIRRKLSELTETLY